MIHFVLSSLQPGDLIHISTYDGRDMEVRFGRWTNGEVLPPGVYFYSDPISQNECVEKMKGWIAESLIQGIKLVETGGE